MILLHCIKNKRELKNMNKKIVTEIVEFEIVEGLEENEFLKIVDFLEENFHSKQKGFIDTELMKGREEGNYIQSRTRRQLWKTCFWPL